MTEEQLRALVREAVERHLNAGAHPRVAPLSAPHTRPDSSHAQFALPESPDGACIIEPAVPCTHCGFCKSYGH